MKNSLLKQKILLHLVQTTNQSDYSQKFFTNINKL